MEKLEVAGMCLVTCGVEGVCTVTCWAVEGRDLMPYERGSQSVVARVHQASFCKSPFPHKSVNVFFISVIIKDKLTNLYGN